MRIVDTFTEIEHCYLDGRFHTDRWENYANCISPSLKDKIEVDAMNYNFNQDILPVLQLLIQKRDIFIQAHNSFIEVTNGLSEKIISKLGIEIDASIVFYLGLCNGAGWATELDERPTVLLGVEKIVELSWHNRENMIALIYHEIGHLWHYQIRKTSNKTLTLKDKSLWQLYTEGIAMYIEQQLCEDDKFYHQDSEGWLNWCNDNRMSLYKEFIRLIDNEESTQQFFGDWCNINGKSDIGYYLGCELIKSFSKDYSLLELANLELDQIDNRIREFYM